MDRELKDKIVALSKEGNTVNQIAKQVVVSKKEICGVLAKLRRKGGDEKDER